MSTGLFVPEMFENLEALRGTFRMKVEPPQPADDCLRRQPASVQTRTEELDASVSTAIHKLKNPLSVIITTSNAIFDITDLTPEELYEYLQQIRSTAHKMDEIINGLLIHSETHRAEAT
jgi:signal transduction histidine kinase